MRNRQQDTRALAAIIKWLAPMGLPFAARSARSLKNLLQEAGMPPWERERLPLIYCADTLVAVPGMGVASGWQAGAGNVGWTITWQRQE